ncbi:MAG: 2-dehydropantoate 2-reductase [Desulfobacca sp.]|nr:2-dehydropantoate 2-reductase [Desulfobacca sp.]
MKIGVVGPGAMGCLLAGRLARSGNEVILLDHLPERVEIINREGLFIEGMEGSFQVRVLTTLNPQDLSTAGLIVNCVKAYDTRTVAQILKTLDPGPLFLTLQNGEGNVEIMGEYLAQEKILAGITSHGATDLGPGLVRHAGQGDTFIGYGFPSGESDHSKDPQLCQVKELLTRAGFVTQLVPKIENLIWSKLLINVGINALTALTRLPNGKLLAFPGTEQILEEAVQEGILVGKKKGIEFIYPDLTAQVKKVCRLTGSNVSSMLQDVLKKKRTEIDFINGVIMREGGLSRIPVPVNTLLTRLIKTIEASYEQTIKEG